MTIRKNLLALAILAAGVSTFAQSPQTDPIFYTDDRINLTSNHWKGSLSRSEVVHDLEQARRNGTMPVAHDISELMKFTPPVTAAAPDTGVVGASGAPDVTVDGYRLVSGEIGYIQVRPAVGR